MKLNQLGARVQGAVSQLRSSGLGDAFSQMSRGLAEARADAASTAARIGRMAAQVSPDPDPYDPGPPPKLPDPQVVMDEARSRAIRLGAITAGVRAVKEAAELYRGYRRGVPLSGPAVWSATKRVGASALAAATYASKRHMMVVGLDSAARMIAWQAANRAKKSATARAIAAVAGRFAGRANIAVTAVEIFLIMHRDIKRFRTGELSKEDFYFNVALTGVSLAAPLAGGALGGPLGATIGSVVAVGASTFKK